MQLLLLQKLSDSFATGVLSTCISNSFSPLINVADSLELETEREREGQRAIFRSFAQTKKVPMCADFLRCGTCYANASSHKSCCFVYNHPHKYDGVLRQVVTMGHVTGILYFRFFKGFFLKNIGGKWLAFVGCCCFAAKLRHLTPQVAICVRGGWRQPYMGADEMENIHGPTKEWKCTLPLNLLLFHLYL